MAFKALHGKVRRFLFFCGVAFMLRKTFSCIFYEIVDAEIKRLLLTYFPSIACSQIQLTESNSLLAVHVAPWWMLATLYCPAKLGFAKYSLQQFMVNTQITIAPSVDKGLQSSQPGPQRVPTQNKLQKKRVQCRVLPKGMLNIIQKVWCAQWVGTMLNFDICIMPVICLKIRGRGKQVLGFYLVILFFGGQFYEVIIW